MLAALHTSAYPCRNGDLGRNTILTHICSELAREKMWSRIHLIPMLQAEEDRDQVRRHFADKARERELLGAETKVYHSDRYAFFPIPRRKHRQKGRRLMMRCSFVRPTFAVTPNEVTK